MTMSIKTSGMRASASETLSPFLRKIQKRGKLDQEDRAAWLGLPHLVRTLVPHEVIVRERDRPTHSCLMLSGLSVRFKIVATGARQIVGIHMAGDMVDLQNSLFEVADHSIQSLTRAEVALIPRQAIRDLAAERPRVGLAMWFDTLLDASIAREWVANVGRRDARARLAHLLCEIALRFELAGLGELTTYELPMTQEQVADTLGLTPVHVNRTIKTLEREGVLTRSRRAIMISDWGLLAKIGDFDSTYLHLDQACPRSMH